MAEEENTQQEAQQPAAQPQVIAQPRLPLWHEVAAQLCETRSWAFYEAAVPFNPANHQTYAHFSRHGSGSVCFSFPDAMNCSIAIRPLRSRYSARIYMDTHQVTIERRQMADWAFKEMLRDLPLVGSRFSSKGSKLYYNEGAPSNRTVIFKGQLTCLVDGTDANGDVPVTDSTLHRTQVRRAIKEYVKSAVVSLVLAKPTYTDFTAWFAWWTEARAQAIWDELKNKAHTNGWWTASAFFDPQYRAALSMLVAELPTAPAERVGYVTRHNEFLTTALTSLLTPRLTDTTDRYNVT